MQRNILLGLVLFCIPAVLVPLIVLSVGGQDAGPAPARVVEYRAPQQPAAWAAYNDCVHDPNNPLHYITPNVTTFATGQGHLYHSQGTLRDYASGRSLPVIVTLTSSPDVRWEADTANGWGGRDCAPGTDAWNTFGGIADMHGSIVYGSRGWYVDITFTGLNPDARYEFAASANRGNEAFTNRRSIFSIIGADSFANASTPGVDLLPDGAVSFCTGNNTSAGYVARWTDIRTSSGRVIFRATHTPDSDYGCRAYAFHVFVLRELAPDEDAG